MIKCSFQNGILLNAYIMFFFFLPGGGGGGGGEGRSEFPASPISYSGFLSPSLAVPASVCFFCCEKLHNVAKFISCFTQLLPPWVSHIPPPVDFPPPLLPGSPLPVPLHCLILLFLFSCRSICNLKYFRTWMHNQFAQQQ